MRAENRPVVCFYPPFVYDLMQFAMFPLNYAIGGLCHLQPKASVWGEPDFASRPVPGTGKSLASIAADVREGRDVAHDEGDLVRLYDSLPAVSAEKDLVGRSWNGRILRTNASVLDVAEWLIIRPLSRIGVAWGKRYRDIHKGDPLLFRFRDAVYAPVPIWGNVGMTDIRWRGVPTATMNYDHQPWKDYFKLLSDADGKVVLLGVWTHKHIAGGWFTLTLAPDVPTEPTA